MESFWITYLTASGVCVTDVWGGGHESALISMREVVRRALSVEAVAVILMHNHPSGDPRPSIADKRLTQEMINALGPIGVRVVDHLIVAKGQVRSFRDMNLIWLTSPQGGQRRLGTPLPIVSRKDPVHYSCLACRSTNVSRDARSDWDAEHQRWVLREVFDYAHCHDCDSATSLQEYGLSG